VSLGPTPPAFAGYAAASLAAVCAAHPHPTLRACLDGGAVHADCSPDRAVPPWRQPRLAGAGGSHLSPEQLRHGGRKRHHQAVAGPDGMPNRPAGAGASARPSGATVSTAAASWSRRRSSRSRDGGRSGPKAVASSGRLRPRAGTCRAGQGWVHGHGRVSGVACCGMQAAACPGISGLIHIVTMQKTYSTVKQMIK